MSKSDGPLKPSAQLLTKLGSIVVHADEMLSTKGHHFDLATLKSLLQDPQVKEWIGQMDALALVPKKR